MVQCSVHLIGQSEPTMKVFNFSESRAALKTIMDDVCSDHAPAVVTRQRGDAVVLLSLQDYNSIMETMHLQSSPANAKRLAGSIEQLRAGRTKVRRLIDLDVHVQGETGE